MPHCLDVKAKIEQLVTNDAHVGSSLFRVFPRTILSVLRTIWEIIINDEDPQEDIAGFENCIRIFIASHSTAEDCHELPCFTPPASSVLLTNLEKLWCNLFTIACARSTDMLYGFQAMNYH
jgi:hypothetical protein